MAPPAAEITTVAPGIFVWQAYDPKVKADLFSTALDTRAGLVIIDPIEVAPTEFQALRSRARAAGVVVTNENHERAARSFADDLKTPIFHGDWVPNIGAGIQLGAIEQGTQISPDLKVVQIEGAPPGEIALHWERAGGTLVIGDALINFEPYGFALLPAKYCSDPKAMRRSLSKLLEFQFERILFAHGTPLISRARERLEQLLSGDA